MASSTALHRLARLATGAVLALGAAGCTTLPELPTLPTTPTPTAVPAPSPAAPTSCVYGNWRLDVPGSAHDVTTRLEESGRRVDTFGLTGSQNLTVSRGTDPDPDAGELLVTSFLVATGSVDGTGVKVEFEAEGWGTFRLERADADAERLRVTSWTWVTEPGGPLATILAPGSVIDVAACSPTALVLGSEAGDVEGSDGSGLTLRYVRRG